MRDEWVMHFSRKFEIKLLDFDLGRHGQGRFAYGGAHSVEVLLRRPTEGEKAEGHEPTCAICESSSHFDPREERLRVFRSLARREVPEGVSDRHLWNEYLDENRRIKKRRILLYELFPKCFQDFCRSVSTELHDKALQTLLTVCWRMKRKSPYDPLRSVLSQWSLDGKTWHPMPWEIGLVLKAEVLPHLTASVQDAVLERVRSGGRVPLGHELLREAWDLLDSNPRSALVIATAAAEVGFKECVADLVPEAEWLVANMPSPPLVRMFQQYLPKLPARQDIQGKRLAPPREIVEVLRKGVYARNSVVHVGKGSIDRDDLEDLLLSIQDLLYLLDYYRGERWALAHVRSKTRKAMEG